MLVAATGVGAGDLATAGFAGSKLGYGVLWAVALGAFLKFVLNEGLARWQLVTGQTLLEGAFARLGPIPGVAFLIYFLPWSFFTAAAMMSACGAAMQTLLPIFGDAQTGRLVWGVAQSVIGVLIAWIGGFRLFERVMAVAIGMMFLTVLVTAVMLRPDVLGILRGLIGPSLPRVGDESLKWTVALAGGVGGTVTILCYGYWIREKGREGAAQIRACRIDLGVAYIMTGLFGMAMIVIAHGIALDETGSGVSLITKLADQLAQPLGSVGRSVFLIGVWAAVFSSLLGVWQAVPYIFADCVRMLGGNRSSRAHGVSTRSWTYRGYLLAIASLPIVQLLRPFKSVQEWYAIVGAAFLPMLALALLILNGRSAWVGREHVNRPLTVVVLMLALVFAVIASVIAGGGGG
jgi:Mn2+/Fe2+ NRAMP family transporter